ncbi:MAG: hypothetical protein AAGF97_14735 [Planctomycetota bacterium]
MTTRTLITVMCYAALVSAVQAGDVLLLSNGELLEGTCQREGDFFVLEVPAGDAEVQGRLRVPVAQVAYQAASRQEVFAHLQSRLGQPDSRWSRLSLAEWAIQNQLYDQAEALLLKPSVSPTDHTHLARVRERLHHARAQQHAKIQTPVQVASLRTPVDVGDLLEPEAMVEFCGFVQPLLINSCVRCHHAGQESTFTLQRPRPGQRVGRRMTQENLVAVLGAIERNCLLENCQSAHGDENFKGPAPHSSWRHGQLQRLAVWVRNVSRTKRARPDMPAVDVDTDAGLDPFDPTPFNEAHPFADTSTSGPLLQPGRVP